MSTFFATIAVVTFSAAIFPAVRVIVEGLAVGVDVLLNGSVRR